MYTMNYFNYSVCIILNDEQISAYFISKRIFEKPIGNN